MLFKSTAEDEEQPALPGESDFPFTLKVTVSLGEDWTEVRGGCCCCCCGAAALADCESPLLVLLPSSLMLSENLTVAEGP